MIKKFAPWLILAGMALATALMIVLYGFSAGVFGASGGQLALAEAGVGVSADLSADLEEEIIADAGTGLNAGQSIDAGLSTPLALVEEETAVPLAAEPPQPSALAATAIAPRGHQAQLPDEMRGVWIATVLNIDFPKQKGDAAAQKKELTAILDTAQAAGLNTIFFQVRPQGDALYNSRIFPWSEYLTGEAGQDPGYDPLAYILEEAHQRGLAVHAWINPYRLTMGSSEKPLINTAALPQGSPVKHRPDLTLAAGDGRLYLNPGEPESLSLVLEGVREILENYQVDGIHLDDYFYPSNPAYDDSATYQKYGAGSGLTLEDWRRANTLELVRQIQSLVEAVRPQAAFGVSPSGIWLNKKTNPLGSESNGFESYSQIYADTRRWVKEGLLDYIAPQLYWPIGKAGSDYEVLARWWSKVCADTKVRLFIGHGVYRFASAETAWQSVEEIRRQVALNRELGVSGSIFYGYQQLKDNTLGLADLLRELYQKPPAPVESVLE